MIPNKLLLVFPLLAVSFLQLPHTCMGVVSRLYKFQKERNNCVYKDKDNVGSDDDCKGWVYKGTGHYYCVEGFNVNDDDNFPKYFYDNDGKTIVDQASAGDNNNEEPEEAKVALHRYSGGEEGYPYTNNPECSVSRQDCREQKVRDSRLEQMGFGRLYDKSCTSIKSWGDGDGCNRECEIATTHTNNIQYNICYCGEVTQSLGTARVIHM